jgi:diaminopimelate decarboxylase
MYISDEKIALVLNRAIAERGLLKREDTAAIFYDLSWLKERIADLAAIFPDSALHAIAVKANPLVRIMKKVAKTGAGFEAASLPELCLAQKTGIAAEKIVYDSPAKTLQELEYAIQSGVHINADSLAELARIDELLKKSPPKGTIGVRINPQVGTGAISALSVAGDYSKFGVPIKQQRQALAECFLKYEWLSGVHLHVGSQGCEIELIAKGIETVLSFAREINELFKSKNLARRIAIFDIGGGLPVSYHHEKTAASMAEYKALLESRFPDLFDGRFKLVTEFGRWIYAHSGWTASRVEYVKREAHINTAMIHVGADLLLRKCYRPEEWHHEIALADCHGRLKSGLDANKYNIAGPLCFAGDIVAREISLPEVEENDYIIIHDTGAYALSMWSRYNSRQIPQVIGYYEDGDKFEVLRERESIERIVEFWS